MHEDLRSEALFTGRVREGGDEWIPRARRRSSQTPSQGVVWMKAILHLRLVSRSLSILCLMTGLAATASAQPEGGTHRLFDEGNILYQQNDFSSALEKYHHIEELGFVSTALYFNMGNAYYKLDQVGRAILYYERALRLDPKDEDVLANLGIANQATVDKITPPPEFALASWLRWALYLFPVSILLRSLAVIYLALGGLAVTLIVARGGLFSSLIRKAALFAMVLLTATSILFLAQWQDSRNRVEAVVLAEELPAMDAPGDGGTELFSIHEGTKVRIDDTSNGWVEIVLLDGKIGWVSSDGIEVI
jgi:tetratricopeptide (TPR) repeat protein